MRLNKLRDEWKKLTELQRTVFFGLYLIAGIYLVAEFFGKPDISNMFLAAIMGILILIWEELDRIRRNAF